MLTRREVLLATGGTAASYCLFSGSNSNILAEETIVPKQENAEKDEKKSAPFRIILNMGTLMGFNLDVEQEIETAAEAGYDGVELWIEKIRKYIEKGGKTADLKKLIEDKGLSFDNAIGFPNWLVDDEKRRAEGVEQITGEMELLAQLGCQHIAAPAAGVSGPIRDIDEAGRRYRTILEIGEKIGVRPLLETWGFSQALGKISVAAAIAIAAAHKDAALLLDAFHTYKGGNSFQSFRMLNGRNMPLFHINDYPAEPPLEKIADGDRVYPGDGICPLVEVLNIMKETGFTGGLSLELFNRNYWRTSDPIGLAKTGLEKIRAVLDSM